MKVLRKTLLLIILVALGTFLYNLKGSNSLMPSSESQACTIPEGTTGCTYIRNGCDRKYYFIAEHYYCSHHYGSMWLVTITTVGLMSLLVLLLSAMSVMVSSYFFPNLHKTTRVLNIKNTVLSFVLVPLSNALPDFINYYYALESKSTNLVLGQLVGYNLIICTIAMGSISILSPLNVRHNKSILFDFGWLLFTFIVFLVFLLDGKITFGESLSMVGIYAIYIVYLIFFDKDIEENVSNSMDIIEETIAHESETLSPSSSRNPLTSSLHSIDKSNFNDSSLPVIGHFLKGLDFILHFIIPVSWGDHREDLEDSTRFLKQNKYLATWYCLEIPLITKYQFKSLHWSYVALLQVCLLSVLSFGTTIKVKRLAVALMGIFTSLILISIVSIQILNILKNLGLILKISDYLLGMMVFSISNSINDLITNITISLNVNPLFGLSSCLGSPLLVVLLGVGVNGCYIIWKQGSDLTFDINNRTSITAICLLLVVIFYLVYIPLNGWNIDKKLGVMVISSYIAISIFNCLFS